MKDDIPRLFPLWLILLLVILFTMCGCRTGGTWVNPGSAGTIITGKTPEQMNEEAKARREESEKFQNAQPAKSPQITLPPARSKPAPTVSQGVEATNVAETPEAAGKTTTLAPTISPTPVKLPPVKTKLPPKLVESDTKSDIESIIIVNSDELIGVPKDTENGQSTPINWVNLFSLFVMLLLGAIGLWVVYDIIKDSTQMKKQGSPIKDHLKNLKKPAKGTRASRKKATTKKKTTRKKKS